MADQRGAWEPRVADADPTVNRLLAGLPPRERFRLVGLCHPVDLLLGAILCEPEHPISHAYFPLEGFISVVTVLDGRPPLELGLIGNEGMLGATLAMGVREAPARGVVQGAGRALRLPAAALSRELRASPVLLRTVNDFGFVSLKQLLQNAACMHFHEIGPRLARWLLMTHDRVPGDEFHLTHGFLADMLGVRRSGVTVAAGMLQTDRLIHYSRGNITVLDRAGLEGASCECYGAMTDAYRRRFRATARRGSFPTR